MVMMDRAVVGTSIQCLMFTAKYEDFRDAAIMLREAVGAVTPLGHSLLGRCPLSAEKLNLDLRLHQEKRRFRDEAGMAEFLDYLDEVIEGSNGPHPELTARGEDGFVYTLASGKAGIGLFAVQDASGDRQWAVDGWACFRNAEIVQRHLTAKGFDLYVD